MVFPFLLSDVLNSSILCQQIKYYTNAKEKKNSNPNSIGKTENSIWKIEMSIYQIENVKFSFKFLVQKSYLFFFTSS